MGRTVFCLALSVLFLSLALTGVASADLVGLWKFDDGSGNVAYDSTGNGNDGVFNGDPQWVEGQLGGALEFDGVGDFLDCGQDPSLAIGEAVSIAVWFKVGGLGLDHKIGGNQDNANGGYKMSIYSNDKVEFEIRTAANAAILNRDVAGGTVLESDTWYHATGVYSQADGYIRTYINGALDREMTTAEALGVSPGTFYIGCEPYNTGGNHFNGVMDDLRLYNHAVTEEEIPLIMLGGAAPELAADPSPEDEAVDVPRDGTLSWTPGEFAATHDVYFGTDWDDVNNATRANPMDALASQNQTAAAYGPGRLDFAQTYYWRVDEVNAAPDNTIFKGKVWSFTVEPFAYPVENITATSNAISEPGAGIENTINGSGLNELDRHSVESGDMWLGIPPAGETVYIQYEFDGVYKLYQMLVWNYNVQFELMLGFGLKDVTVEYSENGTDWLALGDVEFAQATAKSDYAANTTVDFGGVPVKYVRLTVNAGWGPMGQYGLSEVRFLYIPAQAREPQPADGEADVAVSTTLNWRAGREAVTHDVYLGTDPGTLAPADTTTATSYAPATLDLATTYYWRVDEVNEAEAIRSWEGGVWSFSTQEYAIVDNFESYEDDIDAGTAIFQTWIDGWENGTGSTVGHIDSPFAEQTIVHSGGQSMPLFYDNAGVTTAEAEYTFAAQNWTASGIRSLSLYFYGAAGNTGQLYVKINNTRVDYDGDPADIARPAWQPWNIDLSTVGGVANVTKLTIGVEGSGATGVVYIDDIRLYPRTPEYIVPVEPDSAGLVALYKLDGNADDSSGNGNNGTLNGGVQFSAGVEGSALDCDGVDDYVSTGKSASDLGIGGNSPRTVTVWVYTRSFLNGGIYDVGARTNGQDFSLRTLDTLNTWRIQYWGGDFDFTLDTADKWVQFAHVHDGTSTKIYANGVLIVDWETTLDTADTNPFQIGLYGWPDAYFDGLIDELYLYNRALSAEEVLGAAGQTVPRHKAF